MLLAPSMKQMSSRPSNWRPTPAVSRKTMGLDLSARPSPPDLLRGKRSPGSSPPILVIRGRQPQLAAPSKQTLRHTASILKSGSGEYRSSRSAPPFRNRGGSTTLIHRRQSRAVFSPDQTTPLLAGPAPPRRARGATFIYVGGTRCLGRRLIARDMAVSGSSELARPCVAGFF